MPAALLGLPSALLASDATLPVTIVDPSAMLRVSRRRHGEPHFGASGAHRFDAPGCRSGTPEYRSCYFGLELEVAIAESLLHDAIPVNGQFLIASSELDLHYLHRFTGQPLNLLSLTGTLLKRLGGNAALSGTMSYPVTQQWGLAVFQNPRHFDGFIYMSRHLNTAQAVILFDRAVGKLQEVPLSTTLRAASGFAMAAIAFGIVAA